MRQATAYICDYCGTISLHAPYIKGHEKRCRMNPENRCCKSCRWWFKNHPEYANPKDPLRNFQDDPLPFCDNPDEDYSLEIDRLDGGICQEYHQSRENCEGYQHKGWALRSVVKLDYDW